MKKDDRIWQIVICLGPLALCIVYLWSPGGYRALIFDVVMLGMALWSILRNPFREKPRSALLLSVAYTVAAVAALAKLLYGHHGADALWASVFLAFTVGWWRRYRQDVNLRDRATADTSRPEAEHG